MKLSLLVGLTLLVACSSRSPTSAPATDSGGERDASAHDGGGSGNTLLGTFLFPLTFVGSATTSGTCETCGSGGPPSYEGVVVMMSDDPNLQGSCESLDARVGYDFDFARYHYLTIQVTSTTGAAVSVGSYNLTDSNSVLFGYVSESTPIPLDASPLGYTNEDDGTGAVKITSLTGDVKGTFSATDLMRSGAGPRTGELSGSFDAPSCPGLGVSAFQSPCFLCPG
jgi:hypothetical protein